MLFLTNSHKASTSISQFNDDVDDDDDEKDDDDDANEQ